MLVVNVPGGHLLRPLRTARVIVTPSLATRMPISRFSLRMIGSSPIAGTITSRSRG